MFGGESVPFPGAARETLQENYERVWLRSNVSGIQLERWFHLAGCHRWITVERDTLTNDIVGERTKNAYGV